MKRFLAVILLLTLSLGLVSCGRRDAVLREARDFDIKGDNIRSLDIELNAADFRIIEGEEFSLRSNLKYLSVEERGGVLYIEDEANEHRNYRGAMLTLTIPKDKAFSEVEMSTGATKMLVEKLVADTFELDTGAGDVSFDYISVASRMSIEGGAGEILIRDGAINNLTLEMGVGELDLTAEVLGINEFDFGVGKTEITLIGSKEDYRIDIDKGIGAIAIDGVPCSDFGSSGNGRNIIDIDGGVGSVDLRFKSK